jgi:hypothetical protein
VREYRSVTDTDLPFTSLQAYMHTVGQSLADAVEGLQASFSELSACLSDVLEPQLRAAGLMPQARTTKAERRRAKQYLARQRRTGERPEVGIAACARRQRHQLATGGIVPPGEQHLIDTTGPCSMWTRESIGYTVEAGA